MMTNTQADSVRSATMRAVKSKNTAPEMLVRSIVHRLGYRFRLHRKDLPGKPDLVFAGRRKIIFVHGCFWHGHECARGNRIPQHNRDYWVRKIRDNRERDTMHSVILESSGWKILTVWECEAHVSNDLQKKLADFLE
jgi:DNA mismatch endonuclease (patch repair protein)